MNYSKIIYWISTTLVLFFVGLGSIADLLQIDAIRESFNHIHFPFYMLPFFGVAKLAGSVSILIKSQKLLREWAYAGITFYFIGANYVHFAVGDSIDKIGVTLFILVLIITSYIFSKKMSTTNE
ncbi:hypothetical protein AD998_21755 [bacterium 336/3]|nr:hypothetical protein AD998_21755 [bacterium 336/3]